MYVHGKKAWKGASQMMGRSGPMGNREQEKRQRDCLEYRWEWELRIRVYHGPAKEIFDDKKTLLLQTEAGVQL